MAHLLECGSAGRGFALVRKLRLLVVGAGGHGRAVAEAAELTGQFWTIGFLDDAHAMGERVFGVPVLGPVGDMASHLAACDQVVVAIGNNKTRETVTQRLVELGFPMATIIHPRAFVSPTACVGAGATLMAGALVGTEAKLGIGVVVNCGAVVDHHGVVEDFGHLGVNACMAGGSFLGRGAWMQAGSALAYGVSIPAETLKAGQAVMKADGSAGASLCAAR